MATFFFRAVASDGKIRSGSLSGETEKTVAGDLRVHVFLVGRTVEQLIVTGLRTYLEAEISTLPDFNSPA